MYLSEQKKEANEQFGSKINQEVNGNMKLSWKEESNMNGGKEES